MTRPFLHAAAVSVFLALTAGTARGGAEAEVARAIEQLRGVSLDGLSEAELQALSDRLDRAVHVLYAHPRKAERAIRDVLATEREDDFLVIDLARTYLGIRAQSGSTTVPPEVVAALSHVDPNAFADAYFQVVGGMAAVRCVECTPLAAKMLELEELDSYLPVHSLPVDLELGLLFTLGAYGEPVHGLVAERLSSESCTQRANAARLLGILLAEDASAALQRTATTDECSQARTQAWRALGLLDAPELARLASQRLDAEPGPGPAEMLGLIVGLSSSFHPDVQDPLRRLADSDVGPIARRAAAALEELAATAPAPAELRARVGSAAGFPRRRLLRSLERAVDMPAWEWEPSPGSDGLHEALSLLTPADVPLLDAARASVLRRASDECLDEYRRLTYLARCLRAARGEAPAGTWGAASN